MDWSNLHIIKGNNINVAFHYPTFNLIVVNDVTCQMIDFLKKGESMQELSNKYKLFGSDELSFIRRIEKNFSDKENSKVQVCENRRVVDRITLHVTNDCNLRCKYCYAGGGNYNQERKLMTKQTAETFINFCSKNFDQIKRIAFFGGEPMLNIDIMEYICNQFKIYYAEGKSSFIPQFGIITNGTILTPHALQFIKENLSNITVSIDGHKEANDANRIYKNGKGSYKKIHQFIHTILKETNIPIRYEATFTQYHIDAQYKHGDIANFLFNEFGLKGYIVDENQLEANRILDYWKTLDYENLIRTDFAIMPAGFWGILNTIIHKNKREICPIIKDIFAIGIDGTIYPCHMLNGSMKNSLGNIGDKHIFNTTPSEYCSQILHLKQNEKCEKCWSRNLCDGCAVERFYNKEVNEFTTEPNDELCKLTQQHIEQIFLMIANIRKKPYFWSALVAKAKKRQAASC